MEISLIKIYQQYGVPPNLAKHMITVAALGEIIFSHWTGVKIDQKRLVTILLLHDIGNLVKFELDSESSNEMLQNSLPSLSQLKKPFEYWLKKQKQMIDKYTKNADLANLTIIKELGFSSDITDLMNDHSFESLENHLELPRWEKKLIFYCDLRVTPHGLASINARIQDLRERYHHRDQNWTDKKTFHKWLGSSLKLEKQIDQHTNISLNQIQPSDLTPIINNLVEYTIEII